MKTSVEYWVMTTQNSTPARLVDYINFIFADAHGHQRKGIVDFVFALISIQSCSQAALARFFDNFEAASKRLSRFLHNDRLEVDDLAQSTARHLVKLLPSQGLIRLSLDWTIEDKQHLLVASLCNGSRAIPLYWQPFQEGELKGKRSSYERDFIRSLIRVVLAELAPSRLLITADRGFGDVKLMQVLDSLRVAFVIRAKANVKICFQGQWRKLGEVRLQGNQRRRSLGRLKYCQRQPQRYFITQSRKRDKRGRWGIWHLVSNRKYSALETTKEYGKRFTCEEGFRDAKRLLGFCEARIENLKAWARMFTLVALAMLVMFGIGSYLLKERQQFHEMLRRIRSRRKSRSELSLIRAVAELLKVDRRFWELLEHKMILNLQATL